MDSYIEYMIKQKTSGATAIKKILIYLGALLIDLIIMFLMLIFPSMFVGLIPLITIGIFYIAYRICSSFNVEFEYILTNGELDVDKITHKSRRKRLMTIHSKSFTEFGILNKNDDCKADEKEYARIIDASAKSESFDDYFAVFFKNGQKIKLIFNPTQKMIDIFKLYAPRVVK